VRSVGDDARLPLPAECSGMGEDYCRCNRPLELKGAVRVCSGCKLPPDRCQCPVDRWWERGARKRGAPSPVAISRRTRTRWKVAPKILILAGLFMMAFPFIDPVSYSIFTKQLGFPRFLILELIAVAVLVLLAVAFDMARSSNRLQDIWQRRP
jgi:uncharacterized integral membrane protein